MICPKGCRSKYKSALSMSVVKDDHGLPEDYKCSKCGYTHHMTRKEKILEIIYDAEWYFGTPEGIEVDDYCIEPDDVDRVVNQIVLVVEMTRRGS